MTTQCNEPRDEARGSFCLIAALLILRRARGASWVIAYGLTSRRRFRCNMVNSTTVSLAWAASTETSYGSHDFSFCSSNGANAQARPRFLRKRLSFSVHVPSPVSYLNTK